jgi:hypothetical protein
MYPVYTFNLYLYIYCNINPPSIVTFPNNALFPSDFSNKYLRPSKISHDYSVPRPSHNSLHEHSRTWQSIMLWSTCHILSHSSGTHPAFYSSTGVLSRKVKRVRRHLTTYVHLVSRLKMSEAVFLLSIQAFVGWRENLPLNYLHNSFWPKPESFFFLLCFYHYDLFTLIFLLFCKPQCKDIMFQVTT